MRKHTDDIARLINQFAKLPGVGGKTAERFAYYIIKQEEGAVREFARAMTEAKAGTKFCAVCGNYTDVSPCKICTTRDRATVCVVAEAKDVLSMEKMDGYKGTYHVLGGAISPMEGRGPSDLRIKELVSRVNDDNVKEVIMATNADAEGEVTAMYVAKLLKPLGVKVSRIAQGISIGTDLEYVDEVTLSRAFESRREI